MLTYLSEIVANVARGNSDPLAAYAELKTIERELKFAIGEVFPSAMDSAEAFESKNFAYRGFMFQRSAGRANYDFSDIPEIVEAEAHLKQLKERSKQALKVDGLLITADGEEVQPPKVKYSKDSLSCK